jgi:hypothetical protein
MGMVVYAYNTSYMREVKEPWYEASQKARSETLPKK